MTPDSFTDRRKLALGPGAHDHHPEARVGVAEIDQDEVAGSAYAGNVGSEGEDFRHVGQLLVGSNGKGDVWRGCQGVIIVGEGRAGARAA